jgi:hypothetical protein
MSEPSHVRTVTRATNGAPSTPMPPPRQTAPRRARRKRPGPFPVTITQPASTLTMALTPAQRQRRHDAERMAAELTEAARQGRQPCVVSGDEGPLGSVPDAAEIITSAADLAADPAPGALRIGRDLRGRPIAVVLHARTWSLVLRHGRNRYRPTSCAFLDGGGGYSRGRDDLPHLPFCFDDEPSVLGVEWTDMVRAVLAITT